VGTIVEKESYENSGHALRIVLGILIIYFTVLELLQIYRQRVNYLYQIWNWFDFLTIVLVVTGEIMQKESRDKFVNDPENYDYTSVDQKVRAIYSVTSLILWIRVLYFFRIFRSTGYFIRMLV
jgi:hypothetical protein